LKGSKGFGAGHAFTTSYAGLRFPIKSKRAKWPSRWVSPPALKPPSSLLKSEDLGELDVVPLELVRYALFGSALGVALLTDSTPVSTSVLHAAFANARSRPSSTIRQIPPVSPLVEVSLSLRQRCLLLKLVWLRLSLQSWL
jgi:hypothetical protein